MGRSLLLLLLPCLVAADDGDAILRALEARVARAIKEAGPSVVSVRVSRSERYRKAAHWGVPADPDAPGKLDRFDQAAARKAVPDDAPGRDRILKSIAAHDLSDPDHVPEGYGSGFVVDKSGLVLTAAHVVKDAAKVYVRIAGKGGSWADIHAADPRSDLAVLKLLDPPEGLSALAMGDGGAVRKGQFLVSLSAGFAPGFRADAEPEAGWGIVSALRQQIPPPAGYDERQLGKLSLHHYGTLIQTSASVTPGCSGGVLLDLDGKAVGLANALARVSGEGKGGFAIPLDPSTQRIIGVLKRGEEVEYGFLGVVISQRGFGARRGLSIERVAAGSPAALGGMKDDDVILTVAGQPIRKNSDLFLHIGMGLAGGTVKVEVERRGRPVALDVKLAKFFVEGPVIASKRPPARFGLRVDWSSTLSQRNPFARFDRATGPGVVVREVVPGSPADKASLQADKFITRVNGTAVPTPADFYAEIARAGGKAELTVLNSEGRPTTVALEGK
ncbi:MAG: PDZ domain-containing protein [Gemmataceae bacterium]|nr:PDZ domain-containing protein [Gemmataceae bacterium]